MAKLFVKQRGITLIPPIDRINLCTQKQDLNSESTLQVNRMVAQVKTDEQF